MKHLALIFSSILIVTAFFLWILFEKSQNNSDLQNITNQKSYINIEQLKTKLKIHNNNPNIIIQLDWEELGEKEIIELIKE